MAALLGGASMLLDTDRIIEIAPPDASTARFLRAHGCQRYLGLVPPDELDRVRSDAGDLAHLFVPMQTVDEVLRNNADVLIVHGDHRRALWYRRVARARLIAFPSSGTAGREASLASALHRRRRSRADWGGHRFEVREQPPQRTLAPRRYVSQVVGLDDLPELLEERHIRYAVLRWFDELPDLAAGEDLDVLVADEDLEVLWGLLDEQPGTIPTDIYSVSGLPGSEFQSMAYYPPALSAGILDRTVQLPSGYRAPAPLDHFHSLAYHAVYHKGEASGLPTSILDVTPLDQPDHDYGIVLGELARGLGISVPITLEGLDEHLAEVGWQPPRDTLSRLSTQNRWIRSRFFGDGGEPPQEIGLTAFLLRDKAADDAMVNRAEELLRERAWDVLEVHRLSAAERERCRSEIRGGNWGRGPFPTSGGNPAVLIVALDHRPSAPTAGQRRQHPGLTNANTLTVKLALRDHLTAGVAEPELFNPMHSSDGELDAWHYVELAHPDRLDELRRTVEERRAIGPGPVRRADTGAASAAPAAERPGPGARRGRVTAWARSSCSLVARRAKRLLSSGLRRFATWRAAGG